VSVRALIVDDSPTMRALISTLLSRDPDVEVIGTAHDAPMARQMIKELDPDVITLDIEMPHMNGLDFLEKIMKLRPMPVVMVSTLTQKGAEATVRALELGAVDCYGKPSGGMREILCTDDGTLAEIVKQAGRRRRRPVAVARPLPPEDFIGNGRMVAVGSSTGGVEALIQLLQGYPAACPPTVIVQHMPATFTPALAARLNGSGLPTVKEAEDGMPLRTGHVYLAPGGERHTLIGGSADNAYVRLVDASPVSGHRPSVDVLFRSAAQTLGERAVGAILTGMGADGAQGLLEMKKAGASTLAQDEASCVIYGMPKVAAQIGAADEIVSIDRMSQRILKLCSA